MVEPKRTVAVLHRLAAVGATVAVDDFGTGQSSLAYLKALPVGEIKIDKSFVLSMLADASDDAIVCSVVQLAENLGLPVVAEGVEDGATADRLREVGCTTAQGYWYARPMPAAELERWMADRPALASAG